MSDGKCAERLRLEASATRDADWKNWGPYVSDRSWGTVREDYSADGNAWDFFPHDHARSRAYRWNEDGLAGVCNRYGNVCLAVALWNEKDPYLKERLFGLANPEGNHGEDVKEYYFHLDSTPTHSYMKMLYKYPQVEFPYTKLVEESRLRDRTAYEYELYDALRTVFAQDRYFDVFIEYAKADAEDILCRITAINRGPADAPIHLLPHIWFHNTWSWGYDPERPSLKARGPATIEATERHLGTRFWAVDAGAGFVGMLFTENDTNNERLFHVPNPGLYVKDGIHEAVIDGRADRVNHERFGTKAAAHFKAIVPAGGSYSVRIRFSPDSKADPFADFDEIFALRLEEADDFYNRVHDPKLDEDERRIQRQAFAGLMWNKQFYHLGVEHWADGDPAGPPPPPHRAMHRNNDWRHLYCLDVLSMPDKWEYPYFCAWDLAFHCPTLAMIDPEWAKRQLILLLREWYMHPNGQIPAYEWNFSDVNPPVHAWAAWRVYKIAAKITGRADTNFLEKVFQKLLLNFTWWVNRKDEGGKNIFQGGFLGMDNIGVFDRSMPLPQGGQLEQADGTAWMGMYCLNMLAIALELARTRPAYEDVATKFFEHFIYIADAINSQLGLWDDEDGFYYDKLHNPADGSTPIRLRSFVGLVPLFAVETLEPDLLELLPHFSARMNWFLKYRPNLVENIASLTAPGESGRRLLTIVDREKLERILPRMLDASQFLSPYGIRTLSRQHRREPYTARFDGQLHTVRYEPAESTSSMFGGNSNWRGPIWFPVNYLMIESLQKYHHYYGDSFKVECPRYSENHMNLWEVATEISRRLIKIFYRDSETGRRAFFGGNEYFQTNPHWRDNLLFYEHFHGENGAGLGASHQAGWTALIAKLVQQACD